MNTWRTLSSGQIEVNGKVPLLDGSARQALRRQVLERWGEIARAEAARAGVPLAWVIAVIWAESRGNPAAVSPVGAAGLMQLYSAEALAGRTKSEVIAEPSLNIRLGSRYLARIAKRGDTLVEVASKYNAGQARDGSPHEGGAPWGYRENAGYIAAVVEAANTFIELGRGASGSGPTPALPSDRGELGKLVVVLSVIRWLA